MNGKNWSGEQKDFAVRKYKEGESFSSIAKDATIYMGRPINKNMVAGILHKRGVLGARKHPYIPVLNQVRVNSSVWYGYKGHLGIKQLTPNSCRWPIGDPRIDVHFCGDTKENGSPYCPNHTMKAWR